MEILLFVLVLQIGFIAALNNRGHNGNPLIPSARFVNSGQTRRFPDSDSFALLSSRGIPASDSAQSDDEYSSFEDYSYRSVRSNQGQNYYLRYNTRPENHVSLESAPLGRINSNNYVDSFQSSSSLSRRTDPNFRRPYLRNGPPNLRQSPTHNYYRKANDDLSLEVSSLENSKPEDLSRLGDEASYQRSLLSHIEQPNNRRGQNRKHYKKANSLSPNESPIDKLDPHEDAVNSLLSFPIRRRNYRKEYNNQQYDLPVSRIHEPSPVKDIPDAYIDTILLVTDNGKPDEIPIGRPKLGSPERTGLSNNNIKNRRHGGGLNIDDVVSNHLSPSNDNAGLESSLNNEWFPDDDKIRKLTPLRLASLENLNLDSSLLRNGDRKNHNNRKSGRRNFLRLSLSPSNKLTLDEGVASDLSELLSETLAELNLVPLTLRRTDPSNNQYNRREYNKLSVREDNLSNIPVLRLGSVDIPNSELPLRRYYELANRSNDRGFLRKHGNNRKAFKKLFSDNPVKNLVTYHKVKSNKLPHSTRNEKLNNNRRDDFSDEFSLDTLFNFLNEDYDDGLDPDENFSSDLSALRSTNQDHLSLEPPLLRSSDENPSMSKDTDDTLHLEFPWNGAISFDNDKNSKVFALPGLRSKSQLRNSKEKDNAKDTTDVLHFEYPWNDALSSDNDKNSKLSALRLKSQLRNSKENDTAKDNTDILHLEFPWNDALSSDNDKRSKVTALRSKLQLSNSKEKNNAKDTTDVLHLEYPWNDALSSDNEKSNKLSALRSKSQLRNSKERDNTKDTSDVLHLEFPWNDALSADENKTGEFKSKSLLRSKSDNRQDKDPKDELKLEFPWNDKPSPDKPYSKKKSVRTPDPFYVHPYLRNRNIIKHPNYFRRSYDEFTEGIRLEKLKDGPSESLHRHSNRRFNENRDLGVLPLAREDLEKRTLYGDTDNDPSAVITFPLDRRPGRLSTQSRGSPSLLTTTERPNDTVSLLNLTGDKNVGKTYNDTIVFPQN